ncbi:MAG: hypothetical protein KDN19_10770 [Verrucomicrobiae bacterium]|nr:hypothetical protein [Verrucomicrobiae bacterium]
MSPSPKVLRPVLGAIAVAFVLVGCQESHESKPESETPMRDQFTHPDEIATGDDGLVRRNGETEPYTGPVVIRDRDWNLRYFAYYQHGKLHGPEMKFWDDGTLRRCYDFDNGLKIRHRTWFENGNQERDATFVAGHARGPHQTWYEDGSPRWKGNFVGELQWDGHIVDHAPDGTILWDATFDHGRFLSGTYPESEQQKLIEAGMVKPENALYPLKNEADNPQKTEKN